MGRSALIVRVYSSSPLGTLPLAGAWTDRVAAVTLHTVTRKAPSDTSPEARRVLIEALARMGPAERLERMCSLNRSLRELQAARIREEFGPGLTDREVQLRVAVLWIGRDAVLRATGWDAEIEET